MADSGGGGKWRSWFAQWTLQTPVCCLGGIVNKMRRILMWMNMIGRAGILQSGSSRVVEKDQ